MRNIDWDAPLTEDDILWLGQRMTPQIANKIAENKAKFADKSDEDGDPEVTDEYDKWKVPELLKEASGREPAIDVTGLTKKSDLIAALRTWDAAYPDAVEV